MIDFAIGLGQGGSRIAQTFVEDFGIDGVYMNLAGIDFSQFDVATDRMLVLESGGTGRDPKYGEQVVKDRWAEVESFLTRNVNFTWAKYVVVCVGGGGGSGVGYLFPVIDYLIRAKYEVLLVYTLPERREGVPAVPNSIKTLERIRTTYTLRTSKRRISVLPVDNQYCIDRYGRTGDSYWGRVNLSISRALKRFEMMSRLNEYQEYVDMAAGYKAIDANDVRRVLFSRMGFVDVREVTLTKPDSDGLVREIKNGSLTFGRLDIGTTRSGIVSVGMPNGWRTQHRILDFVEESFQAVERATKRAPDIARSSYYNKKLTRCKINMLLSGVGKSKEFDKLHEIARKGLDKMNERGDIQEMQTDDL